MVKNFIKLLIKKDEKTAKLLILSVANFLTVKGMKEVEQYLVILRRTLEKSQENNVRPR